MQNAALVRIFDGLSNEMDVTGGALPRQRAGGNDSSQALTFDEVHREVVLALMHTDFVNGHDVRVLQAGDGLGLGCRS
jgi:hypothetical protein